MLGFRGRAFLTLCISYARSFFFGLPSKVIPQRSWVDWGAFGHIALVGTTSVFYLSSDQPIPISAP